MSAQSTRTDDSEVAFPEIDVVNSPTRKLSPPLALIRDYLPVGDMH